MILFSGVTCYTFQELLYFLYTDMSPRNVTPANCVGLLELANRLCLPRLVTMVEEAVVAKMTAVIDEGGEVMEEALQMLQPCQV